MNYEENKNEDKYNKIKHLVEVDYYILAVFILVLDQIKELHIASDSRLDKNDIELMKVDLNLIGDDKNDRSKKSEQINTGRLKWAVQEYENLRILKIFEPEQTIFVLIRSNTAIEKTIGNILGYYYNWDEVPKNLF